jgi:hypothetical protein
MGISRFPVLGGLVVLRPAETPPGAAALDGRSPINLFFVGQFLVPKSVSSPRADAPFGVTRQSHQVTDG